MQQVIQSRVVVRPATIEVHYDAVLDISLSLGNFYRPFTGAGERIEQLGPIGKELIYGLAKLPGIKTIIISPLELTLYLSPPTDWKQLKPMVEQVIVEATGVHPDMPKPVSWSGQHHGC